jgi:hypothetical protein
LAKLAAIYPNEEDSEDMMYAINAAMNNLTGYPHRQEEELAKRVLHRVKKLKPFIESGVASNSIETGSNLANCYIAGTEADMGNQMARPIAHPPAQPSPSEVHWRSSQERKGRSHPTNLHQLFRRAIVVRKLAIATPSYNGSIEVAARSTLWQFDNPDTAKKSSPSAATLSMRRIVAIDIETGAFEVADDILPATDRLFDRLPDAQPWIVRIGHRVVHRFGSRSLKKSV